jgi:hypothetical protein
MKPTNLKNKKTDIPIPEQRHRVGPKGVSSGISFRNLPPPSLDEIKKICEHYQEKCSGTYKSLASRYVYQMATEIEDLVDVMKGDCSSSDESYPYHRARADKENIRSKCGERTKKTKSQRASTSSNSPSSRRSPASSFNRNGPLRNASNKLNSRQPRHDEKERRRWRKEFKSAHPEFVVATEKDRRRMKQYRLGNPNRRFEDSCSSTSSFSDEEYSRHFIPNANYMPGRKPLDLEGRDEVLRWLVEEGHGLDGRKHDEVLRWLKDEIDRNQYLLKRSKHMHTKELENAKAELEKVKKAAKIVIRAVRKKGDEKAAKLQANVQSERRQRVKSQKMVQSLIKSQSEQLDRIKRLNRPGDEILHSWDESSGDLCDLMADSDLTSVLDELAEEAFQQSYCS